MPMPLNGKKREVNGKKTNLLKKTNRYVKTMTEERKQTTGARR